MTSRFFVPGPTAVRPAILRAMAHPIIWHRSPEMHALLARVYAALPPLFGTSRPVYVGSGGATGMMEAAIRCGTRSRVLAIVTGAFGERFARIAESNGRAVTRLVAEPGDVVEPAALADALAHGDYDAVTAVHIETTTSAVADIAGYARVVAAHEDVLLLVDAVSAVCGVPVDMDAAGIDVVLTASQKALALPPGLAFLAFAERAMERARTLSNRGLYLDVLRMDEHWRKGDTAGTPAIPQLFALDAQLAAIAEEGLPARFARHAAMAQVVQQWVADARARGRGVGFFAREGHRANTVSCLAVDENAPALLQRMRDRGFEVGAGYESLSPHTIRIGHMGDHTVRGVKQLLAVLDETIGGRAA
jgi:aspartate aminotransferase-like enzyme